MTWALITSASARGGAAISNALHAAGLGVVLHHSPRSGAAAEGLARDLLAERAGSVRLWECDLETTVEVPAWLVELGPQVCVCNASVFKESDLADLDRAMLDWAVHVSAHAAILHALRPRLRSAVAVSDIHVDRPGQDHVWYTVAKAGLQSLLLTLAVQWAPHVRCNVVAPGTLPLPADWTDAARAIDRSIPLGRAGSFGELAAAVKWLALDAPYITGQVLAVDGGRSRWLR